jgi:hypothetical protein
VRDKLKEIGFTKPTEVQKQVFASYKSNQNFLIASSTVPNYVFILQGLRKNIGVRPTDYF